MWSTNFFSKFLFFVVCYSLCLGAPSLHELEVSSEFDFRFPEGESFSSIESSLTLTRDKRQTTGCLANFSRSDEYAVLSAVASNSSAYMRIGYRCYVNTNIIQLAAFQFSASGTLPTEAYKLSRPNALQITGPVVGTLPTEITKWPLATFVTQSASYTGTLPSEFGLLNLTQFALQLPSVPLTGTIPTEINSMKTLVTIDWSANAFSGPVPMNLFSNATRSVYLSGNKLTGTIPSDLVKLAPGLRQLNLGLNQFTGTIPSELGLLSFVYLYLDRNQLVGTIPSQLSNSGRTMQVLNLFNNQLVGTIPTEFGILSSMYLFNLFNNRLSGTLPSELGAFSACGSFSVSNNLLTGTIPTQYGNMTQIQEFYVNFNQLSGTFPSQFTNMTTLTILSVSNNLLEGTLPSQLSGLQQLYASSNKWDNNWASLLTYSSLRALGMEVCGLSGTIPADIGNKLPKLERLYLSYNNLAGTIPLSVSNMTLLRVIDLSGNRMSVSNSLTWVPQINGLEINLSDNNLTRIAFLPSTGKYGITLRASKNNVNINVVYAWMTSPFADEVDFSENNLVGSIPFAIVDSAIQRRIDLSNNKLGGTIPREFFSNFVVLEMLDLSKNSFTGTLPSQLFFHSVKEVNVAFNNLTQDVSTFPITSRPSQSLVLSNNNFFGDFRKSVFSTKGSFIQIDYNSIQCIGLPTWCAGGIYFPSGTGACFPCTTTCGDGLKWDNEDCDDGNTVDGDGCSALCRIESGYNCVTPPVNSSAEYIQQSPSTCSKPDEGTSTAVIVVSVVVPVVCLCLLLLLLALFLYNMKRKNNFINNLTKKLQLKSAYVILEEELSMDKVLGEGNFGKVYLGYLNQTTQVAIKEVKHQSAKDEGFQDFITEAKLVSSIPPHPNIVQFMGVCISESKQTIYIVTQYIPNKNLQNFLRHNADTIYTEKQIELCVGIAAGMGHLAKFSIVHNDLAARNILVEEVIVRNEAGADNQLVAKVADFGLANSKHSRMNQSQTLPVRWTAPEVLMEPESRSVNSDVWSFGVVMYEIMTKCKNIPYHGMNNAKVYQSVVKSKQVLECPTGCPDDVYQVMVSCWRSDPGQRPAFSKLHGVLTQIFQFYSSKSGTKSTSNYASTLTSTIDMTSGKETEYWNTLGGNVEDEEKEYMKSSMMENF